MNYQVLNIEVNYDKIGGKTSDFQPTMSLYLPDNSPEIDLNRKRPTVIVCPGGGYRATSDREAEPIALRFVAADYNAVVVRYSCAPARFPTQLLELAWVMATVRAHADEWCVDTDKIVICGFSAGGHLCASFGTLWNHDFIKTHFGYEKGEHKPNGMVLCYPVITMTAYTHGGSRANLLGDKCDDVELVKLLSAEQQVSADTPPAFIWHTFNDGCVPVKNSLAMAAALEEQGVSTELHIFPNGEHGLSLSNETVYGHYSHDTDECQVWIDMAIRWIKNL